MEKTGPEGATAGARRLYWNRTGGCTGGRDSVGHSAKTGGDVEGGGEADSGDAERDEEVTERGSTGDASENRKEKETDGESETVEEGEV